MSDRSVIQYVNSNDLLSDAKVIIESAQKTAFAAVNVALVNRNWLLGKLSVTYIIVRSSMKCTLRFCNH